MRKSTSFFTVSTVLLTPRGAGSWTGTAAATPCWAMWWPNRVNTLSGNSCRSWPQSSSGAHFGKYSCNAANTETLQ
ncbi:hypothetical protein B484DRAFT_444107 [Ochromonadaceae sp. CCMP2298]|nr:hypothetical protein B484DRAFT_444107 [Ochromonadaceae sp. CCMP2298]